MGVSLQIRRGAGVFLFPPDWKLILNEMIYLVSKKHTLEKLNYFFFKGTYSVSLVMSPVRVRWDKLPFNFNSFRSNVPPFSFLCVSVISLAEESSDTHTLMSVVL